MASCTAPSSSLMLTHATSSIIHSQDLSPSIRSFAPKPLSRTFFLSPLVLKPANFLHVSFQSRSSHSLVAALAAEVEVAETVDEDEQEGAADGSATVATTTTKPKTGKAALLLKRDRVFAN